MTKFEFQTGDKVLVRDYDSDSWAFHHFSHMDGDHYRCGDWPYEYCIPYNETTKHLCGTSDPYIDPAEAPAFEFGDTVEYTEDGELKKGIFCCLLVHDRFARVISDDGGNPHCPTANSLRLMRKGNFND